MNRMIALSNMPIQRKLTWILMAVSGVAVVLMSAGFLTYELATFDTSTKQELSTLADILASQSRSVLAYGDERDGKELLDALIAKRHITAACLYRTNEIFAVYNAPRAHARVSVPAHPEKDVCRFESDGVVLFRHVDYKGVPIGSIYLKSDLLEKKARLQLCAAMAATCILISSAAAFFLAFLLQRIISRPISHLAQTARTISEQKNYSIRAEKQCNDELGQLIDGFNGMLEQIQQRDAALQKANDQLEQHVHERTKDLERQIVERERAEGALQEQLMRTSLLNQIAQVISERQDLESILYVVLRHLEDYSAVDLGLVGLLDPAADSLHIMALRLKNPHLAPKLGVREGAVLSLHQSGLRQCRYGEIVNMPDTIKIHAQLTEQLAAAGYRSTVAIPLMAQNKPLGVLMVARLNPDSISSNECDFLHTLSEHVAQAVHRAQLHTELQKAYDELRQTQNTVMQHERLKALGQMASGIAHDVNNALSPIVGFADLLSKSELTLSTNGQKYLQFIRTAGDDITHIVARLREFYRHRNEREPLAEVNLNELARQVIDMTRPRWRDIPQGRGIMVELHTDFDESLPRFAGIESEIREAVTNLVINAVDAVPHGGVITVRTRSGPREFAARESNRPTYIALEVSDTGIGMDEDTRKRCLEPFFSTKGQRGTGLGLAMVYGVMERHEGKIEIESELGKGTVVKLIFPLRSAITSSSPSEAAHVEASPSLHILCIDDEPLLRELMQELLEKEGHHVVTADSGQGGVGAFRAAIEAGRPFDVIFTDLGMPYFDGRQVAKVVKRESPSTPIIMLTGWGAFMKEDGEIPPQVDGILSKPPRSREIRETLQRVRRLSDTPKPEAGGQATVVTTTATTVTA